MNADEETIKQWIDAYTNTLIDNLKTGKGVTINRFWGQRIKNNNIMTESNTIFYTTPNAQMRYEDGSFWLTPKA